MNGPLDILTEVVHGIVLLIELLPIVVCLLYLRASTKLLIVAGGFLLLLAVDIWWTVYVLLMQFGAFSLDHELFQVIRLLTDTARIGAYAGIVLGLWLALSDFRRLQRSLPPRPIREPEVAPPDTL